MVGEPVAEGAIVGSARVFVHVDADFVAVVLFRDFVCGEADDCELAGEEVVTTEIIESGKKLARDEVARGAEYHHDAAARSVALLFLCSRWGVQHACSMTRPPRVICRRCGSTSESDGRRLGRGSDEFSRSEPRPSLVSTSRRLRAPHDRQ